MDFYKLYDKYPELAENEPVSDRFNRNPYTMFVDIDPVRKFVSLNVNGTLALYYGEDMVEQSEEAWRRHVARERQVASSVDAYVDIHGDDLWERSIKQDALSGMPPAQLHDVMRFSRWATRIRNLMHLQSSLQDSQHRIISHSKNIDRDATVLSLLGVASNWLESIESEVSPDIREHVTASRRSVIGISRNIRHLSGLDKQCASLDAQEYGLIFPFASKGDTEILEATLADHNLQ